MTVLSKEAWAGVMASHSRRVLRYGPTNVDRLLGDAKRMAFFHSRYKFAAKMLRRCKHILDVGCGDGIGTLTLVHDTEARRVTGLDGEKELIDFAVDELLPAALAARPQDDRRLEFVTCDFLNSPYVNFDGLCCLDVIEHIDPAEAGKFIDMLARSLQGYGVAVIGTPSLASAQWASEHSRIGHINLYDADRLHRELRCEFSRVLMFSMNDEMVHTGHEGLAHYHLAVCVK